MQVLSFEGLESWYWYGPAGTFNGKLRNVAGASILGIMVGSWVLDLTP